MNFSRVARVSWPSQAVCTLPCIHALFSGEDVISGFGLELDAVVS